MGKLKRHKTSELKFLNRVHNGSDKPFLITVRTFDNYRICAFGTFGIFNRFSTTRHDIVNVKNIRNGVGFCEDHDNSGLEIKILIFNFALIMFFFFLIIRWGWFMNFFTTERKKKCKDYK